MQQFCTEKSGYWTLTAWGIVQDFRGYAAEARHSGRSPVEVAGVDLEGLPWLLDPCPSSWHNLYGLSVLL